MRCIRRTTPPLRTRALHLPSAAPCRAALLSTIDHAVDGRQTQLAAGVVLKARSAGCRAQARSGGAALVTSIKNSDLIIPVLAIGRLDLFQEQLVVGEPCARTARHGRQQVHPHVLELPKGKGRAERACRVHTAPGKGPLCKDAHDYCQADCQRCGILGSSRLVDSSCEDAVDERKGTQIRGRTPGRDGRR